MVRELLACRTALEHHHPHGGFSEDHSEQEEEVGFIVRRARAALRKFDSDHEFWVATELFVDRDGVSWIEMYYRNPELAGIWLLRYAVLAKCMFTLQTQGLITRIDILDDGTEIFGLSTEGKKRLT